MSAPGEPHFERLVTLGASLVFPGEDKACPGQASGLTQRRGFLLFLAEEFANPYGALFLSRSYCSKIASTSARDIATPRR